MTTAFVLSGGGSFGAIQVGMLRALLRRRVRPDLVIGASVGSLNGLWLAANADATGVDGLVEVWRTVGDHDAFPLSATSWRNFLARPGPPLGRLAGALGTRNRVFRFRPLCFLQGVLGHRDHVVPSEPLEAFLRSMLPVARLEETPLPFYATAADVCTGELVAMSDGDSVNALMASCAIPGVFPPVRRCGRLLMDGGVADRTPVDLAVTLGADEVYVLWAGIGRHLDRPPTTAFGIAGHALALMIEQRLLTAVMRYESQVAVHVVPSPSSLDVLPFDFSQTEALIESAAEATDEWAAGVHPDHPSARPQLGTSRTGGRKLDE